MIPAAGIDLSLTATGLVVIHGSGNTLHREVIKPPRSVRSIGRYSYIARQITTVLHKHMVDVVAIEGYAFGAKSSSKDAIAELGGVVRDRLWARAIQMHVVSPSTLKKLVTGKGNSSKGLVTAHVEHRFKFLAVDDNEADAFGLAKMMWCKANGRWHRKADEAAWKATVLDRFAK